MSNRKASRVAITDCEDRHLWVGLRDHRDKLKGPNIRAALCRDEDGNPTWSNLVHQSRFQLVVAY